MYLVYGSIHRHPHGNPYGLKDIRESVDNWTNNIYRIIDVHFYITNIHSYMVGYLIKIEHGYPWLECTSIWISKARIDIHINIQS